MPLRLQAQHGVGAVPKIDPPTAACARVAPSAALALRRPLRPRRRPQPLPTVASINVCADQHVLALADPEQILTVSWLAADPEESLLATEARRYTLNYGTAEELLEVRSRRRARRHVHEPFHARDCCGALGYRVVELEPETSVADIERNVRLVAQAVGQVERGEQLVASVARGRARDRGEPPNAARSPPSSFGPAASPSARTRSPTSCSRSRATQRCGRARPRPLGQLVDGGAAAQRARRHRADRLSQLAAVARERRARAIPRCGALAARRNARSPCRTALWACGLPRSLEVGRAAAASGRAMSGRPLADLRRDAGLLAAASALLALGRRRRLAASIGRDGGGPTFGFGGPGIAGRSFSRRSACRARCSPCSSAGRSACAAPRCKGCCAIRWRSRGCSAPRAARRSAPCIMFYFGLAGAASLLLPLGAVGGSLLALAALYALAGRRGDFLTIVLAGIAINALAAALTSLALNFAPSPYAALEILFWMLGSLADRSLAHVYLALPLMVPGWLLVAAAARGLDALTLGEDTASSLGFDPQAHASARHRRHRARRRRRGRRHGRRRLRRPRRAAPAARRRRPTPEPPAAAELSWAARCSPRSPTSRSGCCRRGPSSSSAS